MRRHLTGRLIFLSALCVLTMQFCMVGGLLALEPDTVTVFAAASTTNAVTDIGQLFMDRKLGRFTPSFASSSTLAKQIENGAPADVYISANWKWMNYLEERKMIVPSTRFDLLGNRIVLIAPSDSTVDTIDIGPGFDLVKWVKEGWLAMGDPDHVPAGIYGKQALESLGVWTDIKDRIARTKDVRAALALVQRGESRLGLVYATDAAITDSVKVVGVFPENTHSPIVYPVAVVAGRQTPVAGRFMDFLRTPAARAVFEKYGFMVR